MPCEDCSVEFTVFKRKRYCMECKRYYCNQCLIKRNNIVVCEKCLVFTKRPLHKTDLQKLKAKDLIFYLQSKHISTTGCVEKDELVSLILIHVNSSKSNSRTTSNASESPKKNSPIGNKTNPFHQLKQSCQNFFTTVTEKIAADMNFNETASAASSSAKQQNNISEQPRPTEHEMPAYYCSEPNSSKNSMKQSVPNNSNATSNLYPLLSEVNGGLSQSENTSPSCSTSPVNSINCSTSSQSVSSQQQPLHEYQTLEVNLPADIGFAEKPRRAANNRKMFEKVLNIDTNNCGNSSGCECSDDEVITTFEKARKDKCSPIESSSNDLTVNEDENQLSDITTADSLINQNSLTSTEQKNEEKINDSSGSSFEELGAVGGNTLHNNTNSNKMNINQSSDNASSGSSATTNSSDTENWQIINNSDMNNDSEVVNNPESINNLKIISTVALPTLSNNLYFDSQIQRRINRRRSDGFIYNNPNRSVNIELLDFSGGGSNGRNMTRVDEEDSDDNCGILDDIPMSRKRLKKSCKKCGKTKKTLKNRVAKFQKYLETKQLTDNEIQDELKSFLEFLELRQKSIECSDESETNSEQLTETQVRENDVGATTSSAASADYYDDRFFNDNDGIHVYAHDDDSELIQPNQSRFDNRFISLTQFRSIEEFDDLTVKQLKEILMLNRVDYKGCCEKQELLERVHRLWKNLQECPSVDKLQVDDLCKICMDAPIECVILECGHMATCTNCGKVLSECPICRQYIVRVVRFFRA